MIDILYEPFGLLEVISGVSTSTSLCNLNDDLEEIDDLVAVL